MKKEKILIIAPHCDDEILGCGGTISHFNKLNYEVYVLVITNAHKGNSSKYSEIYINKLRKECLNAHKILSVKKTFFLEFPAPYLDKVPIAEISDKIKEYVDKIKPSFVFIPFIGDSHVDHQITHKASLVALRPNSKLKVKNILCYETLSETEWGDNISGPIFTPNFYIQLKKIDIAKKMQAMKKYKSQIKKFPHSRSLESINNLAKTRGASINTDYAESFVLVRMII